MMMTQWPAALRILDVHSGEKASSGQRGRWNIRHDERRGYCGNYLDRHGSSVRQMFAAAVSTRLPLIRRPQACRGLIYWVNDRIGDAAGASVAVRLHPGHYAASITGRTFALPIPMAQPRVPRFPADHRQGRHNVDHF
jgi:hypothetical protein